MRGAVTVGFGRLLDFGDGVKTIGYDIQIRFRRYCSGSRSISFRILSHVVALEHSILIVVLLALVLSGR